MCTNKTLQKQWSTVIWKEYFVIQLLQQYQEYQLQMKVMMLWYKFYMKGLEMEK